MIGVDVHFYVKIWPKLTHPLAKCRFSIYFCSCASAVTPRKNLINTNRKSTMRFPTSLRWISYVAHKLPPPRSEVKNAKCPKFKQYSAITLKRYEIRCQLLLITNRKSHTGFRLVPISVTLNDLERPITSCTVVRDLTYDVRKISPKLTHRAARSLCDSWATCLKFWCNEEIDVLKQASMRIMHGSWLVDLMDLRYDARASKARYKSF